MRDARTDLVGEVARVRSECNHLMHLLDLLDSHGNHREWLSEDAHQQIMGITTRYSQSAADHLEYAADNLLQWLGQIEPLLMKHA